MSSIFNVHTSTNNPQTLSLGVGAVLRLSGLMVGTLIGEISCRYDANRLHMIVYLVWG